MCWDICEQFRIIARIGRKEERERERESRHGCLHDVRFDSLFFPSSFLAACVRSSAGRLIPVVWSSEGFIYDCLQQTSEADTTVGSDLLGSESTQPSSSHFFRVCLFATMGRGRRRWLWRKKLDLSLTERARYSHDIFFPWRSHLSLRGLDY